MNSKWFRVAVSFFISLFFLFLAFRKAEWKQSWQVINNVDPFYLFLTIVITAITILIRAYRWKYFFVSPLKLKSLFVATSIGLMVNNLLPARVGEIARAYVLGLQENVSKVTSFGTVVLERTFDVSIILLLFGAWVLILSLPTGIIYAGYIALAFDLVALFFLIVLKRYPIKFSSILMRMLPVAKLKERSRQFILSFGQGLQVLESWKTFLEIFFWSVVLWGAAGLGIVTGLKAFHIDTPFWAAFLVLALLSIGMMIPSAPGSVGPFQYFTMLALSFLGVSDSEGLGFALGFNAINFAVLVVAGILCVISESIPFEALRVGELNQ